MGPGRIHATSTRGRRSRGRRRSVHLRAALHWNTTVSAAQQVVDPFSCGWSRGRRRRLVLARDRRRCAAREHPRPSRSNSRGRPPRSRPVPLSTDRPPCVSTDGAERSSGRSAITIPPEGCRGGAEVDCGREGARGAGCRRAWRRAACRRHTVACPSRGALEPARSLRGVTIRLSSRRAPERFGAGGPAVDPLPERAGLAGRDARRLAISRRRSEPVRDHVRTAHAVAPVTLVHVLITSRAGARCRGRCRATVAPATGSA